MSREFGVVVTSITFFPVSADVELTSFFRKHWHRLEYAIFVVRQDLTCAHTP